MTKFNESLEAIKSEIANLGGQDRSKEEIDRLAAITSKLDELGKTHGELEESNKELLQAYASATLKKTPGGQPPASDEPQGKSLEECVADVLAKRKGA